MKLRFLGGLLAVGCLLAPAALAKDPKLMYPRGYELASKVTKMPEFIVELGTLCVDPKLLPVGPYVGYDKDGQLVNAVYLVPVSLMDKRLEWLERGTAIKGFRTDHVDITFHQTGPEMKEPHYRIVQWTIGHQAHQKSLGISAKETKKK